MFIYSFIYILTPYLYKMFHPWLEGVMLTTKINNFCPVLYVYVTGQKFFNEVDSQFSISLSPNS